MTARRDFLKGAAVSGIDFIEPKLLASFGPRSMMTSASRPPAAIDAQRRSEHTSGRHAHSVWHKEHGQPKTMPLRMRGSLLPLACDILD
jgi:hypothetical protein